MGDMDPHIFAVAEEAYKQMARLVEALLLFHYFYWMWSFLLYWVTDILKYSE